MWSFQNLFIVLLLTTSLCIYIYFYIITFDETELNENHILLLQHEHRYIVDSPTCKILDLEPFDARVRKYFHVHGPKICSKIDDLTQQRGNMLILNRKATKDFCRGGFTHCEYRSVIRVGDFKFAYSPAIIFKGNIGITSEFIRVKCFCLNRKVYTNFHAFVHAVNKSTTLNRTSDDSKNASLNSLQRVRKALPSDPNSRLNVVMIGVDSISRLNSYRQLSNTRNFLLKKLGGIELKSYNKVADNTFVNLVPLLLGKYIEEIPWNATVKKLPFDKYDLMWKKYHRKGYKTLYAEDYPLLSTFYLGRKGFIKPPTDHYLRPLTLAMEKEKSVWWSDHQCVNGRLEIQIFMQYILDFAEKYKSEPHFSFSFNTRLSHDNVNLVGVADYAFKDFFQKMNDQQLLNNTLLFFFSDHGIRFGPFRNTTQGKLEERLPMMYIVPPKWFPKRFPRLWRNLKANSRRLTTPFDIHETLKSVLDLTGFQRNLTRLDPNTRGISLFGPIPENRTCESATIKPHWCVCQQGQELPVNEVTVVKVAKSIVSYINKLLRPEKGKCASLVLAKVQHAVDIYSVDYRKTMLITSAVYQLTLWTIPGRALFEATVNYDAKTKKIGVLGDISRINKYGTQSNCTSKQELKKYCYCK